MIDCTRHVEYLRACLKRSNVVKKRPKHGTSVNSGVRREVRGFLELPLVWQIFVNI